MASLNKFLSRVFSQKVILRRMPGNRLKNIDYDRLQSIDTNLNHRYSGVKTSRSAYQQMSAGGTNTPEMVESARLLTYADYESMESDAILSTALDIYANEITVKNAHNNVLTITCDNPEIKAILYNLFFDILEIEFNLWSWVRSTLKYGDFFLLLETRPSVGIIDVVPFHPSVIRRDDYAEENQDETMFYYEGMSPYTSTNFKSEFRYHEMAHFRLLTDTSLLPYGRSILEGTRKTWKQLTMMEDAMLIHRIMRAPERRLIKVGVGNLPNESIDAYIEEIANSMKKVPYIDPQTGDYNLRYNLMSMLEDFYIAKRGGEGDTEIDTLGGMSNEGSLEDIEYLQRKQMAYLKIPRAYLGYDEGVEGKGTLAAEDIQFARTAERYQMVFEGELHKIGFIHLLHQGFDKVEASQFKIQFSTPSIIYERQKVDLLNEQVSLVENLLETKLFSRKWVYENIFNMTEEEWLNEQTLVIQDLKRRFREEQIETEGNDPEKSGRSFGTPHDVVAMQLASSMGSNHEIELSSDVRGLYDKDGRHNNPGRPLKPGSFERDKDPHFGRDPSGRKAMVPKLHSSKSLEHLARLLKKNVSLLNEDKKSNISNGLLDESKLLED